MLFNRGKLKWLLLVIQKIAGISRIAFDQSKQPSYSIKEVSDTTLGKACSEWSRNNGNASGFYPLLQGMDALGIRLRLAEQAEISLDLQYFLVKDDTSGTAMADALLRAADRGVRIRLLLDDVFTAVPDRKLMLLNQHPKIEIRMFNPISRHGFYNLNFLGNFKRANRRMHNKSFSVDNSVSVIGGRNIADEYFQLNSDSLFFDFDMLTTGPIVPHISASFDEYWNHVLAIPLELIVPNTKNEQLQDLRKLVGDDMSNIYNSVYKKAFQSELLQDLFAHRQPLYAAQAKVISDNPDKLITEIGEDQMHVAMSLRDLLRMAREEVMFITPYYVPGKPGIELIQNLTERGIRVLLLTNSLASNNHVAVHSAYARYRKAVIDVGVELYEARANALPPKTAKDKAMILTLHTKALVVDRKYLFVGSPNFDPRSIRINAEMGLLIESQELAQEIAGKIDSSVANIAYRVSKTKNGHLEWRAIIGEERIVETSEPLASRWLRFKAWILKIAPENQL